MRNKAFDVKKFQGCASIERVDDAIVKLVFPKEKNKLHIDVIVDSLTGREIITFVQTSDEKSEQRNRSIEELFRRYCAGEAIYVKGEKVCQYALGEKGLISKSLVRMPVYKGIIEVGEDKYAFYVNYRKPYNKSVLIKRRD